MPEDKTLCSSTNFSFRLLRVTLVLASLANQISMGSSVAASEMLHIRPSPLVSSVAEAAGEINFHDDRLGTSAFDGSSGGDESFKGRQPVNEIMGQSGGGGGFGGVADKDNNEGKRKRGNNHVDVEGVVTGKTPSFATKLSPFPTAQSSSSSSSSTFTAAAPATAAGRPTYETSTLSASAEVPRPLTGIANQNTDRETGEEALTMERIITPLPLINRPPDATARHVQQNSVNSRNQSSSHSPVNDLQVDEKHFLNEIVKNFNKSIVLNAFEFASTTATAAAAEGHNTMAANETGSTALTSTNHIPRADNAVVPAATDPSTSPILNSMRSRTHSATGGGVSSSNGNSNSNSGSASRNPSSSKIHYHKSDSAMLNYIFDSHVKHRHSDLRFGPHFVQMDDMELLNSSAVLGGVGLLSCKISQLQDKTVSWVRRLADTNEMLLLTVGMHTYSSDARFRVDFLYPDDWRLRIDNATKADEGTYVCQISTHPPQAIQTNFYVSSPEVLIVDEQGLPLYEKFYNLDSLLELNCIVNHITMTASVVHWHHGNVSLNYDATRGGISVGTNLTEDAANSTLWVARVKPSDSGNYTCSVGPHLFFTTSVHVLNESLAELHHGRGVRASAVDGPWLLPWCIILVLLLGHSTTTSRGMSLIPGHHLNAMPVAGQTHIR